MTESLFKLALRAPGFCLCRCTPNQKTVMVKLLKRYSGEKIVAAIGDGDNDFGMLNEADLGIVVAEKHNSLITCTCDFSVHKFSEIRKLILWYGRQSYRGSSNVAQYVIQRCLTIGVIQSIFTILFFSVPIPIFNGYLMIGFATIYTSVPVFQLLFD